MAKLYFRYGAMNSGKSTGLLQTAYNYEERGQRVLLLKAVVDTKGEDSVVSRLGGVAPRRPPRRHRRRPACPGAPAGLER